MKKTIALLAMLTGVSLMANYTMAQDNTITSKFDFIPGEKVILYDDFASENIGDFPTLWNTTGSGEVVTTTLAEGRWFQITNARGIYALTDPLVLTEKERANRWHQMIAVPTRR